MSGGEGGQHGGHTSWKRDWCCRCKKTSRQSRVPDYDAYQTEATLTGGRTSSRLGASGLAAELGFAGSCKGEPATGFQ